VSLPLDPAHSGAMCSDIRVLGAQDQWRRVAGRFKRASLPRKLMAWLAAHLHSLSGMRAASQLNYLNRRKINALAMPVLFLARRCQNSASKHILSHNRIRSVEGTTLPGLVRSRDEHLSLQDLHHIQNAMPETKRLEKRRRGQHVCDAAWSSSLCTGDPMKNLNMGS